MYEELDTNRVYQIVWSVAYREDFFRLDELEEMELDGFAEEYNLDLSEFSLDEKDLLWKELLKIAREYELIRLLKTR